MAISNNFTIDYVNKRITHSSGSTWYTVNELYSYLQDTFDDLDQMDDPIPMSAQTPTDYTLINGWFMDDASFQYLKGGAIQTSGWASGGVRQISYSAGTAFGSSDIGETITGSSSGFDGAILNYDSTRGIVWIRPSAATDTFNNSTEAYTVSNSSAAGSFTSASSSGEALYSNVYTLGTINQDESQQIYIVQSGSTMTSWWPEAGSGTQHIDVLIKVKEVGNLIDSGNITVYLRHYTTNGGDLYDHFAIDVSSGGRNAVPLATQEDLNNTTSAATVRTSITDVTIGFVNGTITHSTPPTGGTFSNFETVTWGGAATGSGVILLDSSGTMTIGNISGDNPANGVRLYSNSGTITATATADLTAAYTMSKNFEQQGSNPYTIIVDCGGNTIDDVYEYFKYVTREGQSTFQAYPITRTSNGTLTWAAQDGEHYIRGYVDNQTTGNTFTVVKASPFGTFAGGKLFAAQGVWVENMADADIQAFQLRDSTGNTQTPPNKQVISVSNVKQSDRVTVFRTDSVGSSNINKSMYSSTTYNTTGATTFRISTSVNLDTPTTGTLRLVDATDSSEERYAYSAFSGSTFSLSAGSTLNKAYDSTEDTAYVPYIDEEVAAHTGSTTTSSVTVIYTASRGLLVRVRRKAATPILPFEAPGTFSSTGFSIATIRTEDTIVS